MNNESCCDDRQTHVTRVILGASVERSRPMVVKSAIAKTGLIVDYKAAANRSGTTRNFSKSKSDATSGYREKSAVLSTLTSLAIPGDISPIRSPIRSAVYRTITPGKPGFGGSVPTKPNRGYRCPEGYQYGGRFTDSRLSTCGMKLFDIPSPLGMALAAIRRSVRRPKLDGITSGVLGGIAPPGDPTVRRDPNVQIPKVSSFNKAAFLAQIKEMINGLSSTSSPAARMVRRDGFVLQPVVPARVLRSIPDNRDMEGAAYLTSVLNPRGFGKDEVGLLSNTGVNSVTFVLPGGSTISLSKARDLTVGERRKLGKTIRTAESMATPKDPTGNMKYIADQMGDGIAYSESFVNIKNPNEIVNGKPKWITSVFSEANRPKKPEEFSARETVSSSAIGKKINSLDAAVEHILGGGSLSQISPDVLAKILASKELVKLQKINSRQSMVVINGQQYILYSPKSDYAHLAERFASDVQQYLSLESPDVLLVGKPSDKRKYLVQGVESAVQGAVFNPNAKMSDFKPEDVAKMMVSDFLTDQRVRDLSSVHALTTADGEIPMFAQNPTSGLTELSKIEITKRMKMSIAEFYNSGTQIDYSEYYQALKIEQQLAYRRMIEQLITRAKNFKVADIRRRLKTDGLSAGELAHLEIIEKIYTARMNVLSSSKKMLTNYLKGM
jgi:hypothetical protein